ncbi:ATP-binding protein [Streptomyces antarcticus]|uniref:ATP-binding protein n=1 Tax=Streptomyces antarcticus TaxID=2996458 RepID=UPI0022717CBF|nr:MULTISPECIES: ATP-binding protein [unclassified Streptomyces]MCY0940354.1 ATP-binding protein [Streptomyces sp. H34-AA3]MCY0950771.1 ATP-binding protein [Streptomyces sp. H27-S2]MCZ4088261.1 ATP-binding protein [Streptomyces sp. H34-S5]
MNAPTAADDTRGSTRRGDRARADDATPATAAAARARVCELLRRAGISLDSVTAADALLVTSELVTNAIRHGGGITAFHTEIADDALILSVSDASPRAPVPRTGSVDHPGGYGWPLVQRLAERVDISSHPGGKTIGTTLRLT